MRRTRATCGASSPRRSSKTPSAALLHRAAERWPRREALVSVEQGIRWTFAELNRRVDECAAGLLALGLEAGDRVAIWAPNCAEWALTQFATARVGLIQVNVNPAYRLSELEYTLKKVGVKMLIAASAFKTSDYLAMTEALAPEIASSRGGSSRVRELPQLKIVAKIGGAPRAGLARVLRDLPRATSKRCAPPQQPLDRYDADQHPVHEWHHGPAQGRDAVPSQHRQQRYLVGRAMGLRAGDRLCMPVPLYHCFGMVMANLACVVHGATMVYPSAAFDPLAVLKTVQSERCTALHGVPTMFIAELEHPQFAKFDLSSLRAGIMAGSPCPIEVMRRVIDRMHMSEVTIAYGMTETSPVSFQSLPTDPLERRVTTVGRIQPHMEAKVIDAEGRMLGRGEAGELCTRGYAVMLGYWDDPEKTAEAIDAEGWMHTGDLAVIDEEGYCNIVGRSKDMIIRGGENVYPREIEEFLFRHPKVADVAIVGVPCHEVRRGSVRVDQAARGAQRNASRRSSSSAADRSRTTRCRRTWCSSTPSR